MIGISTKLFARLANLPVGGNDVKSRGRRRQQMLYYAFATTFILAATALLGIGYIMAAYPGADWADLESFHLQHVGLALTVNLFCALLAVRLRGPAGARLQSAILYALIIHLAVIIVIFGMRLYYSRTVMILGLLASLSLVSLLTVMTEKFRHQLVGLLSLGSAHETSPWLGNDVVVVNVDRQKPTDFDVLLVDWSLPLDQKRMWFVTQSVMSGCSIRHIPEYIEHKSGRVLPEHFQPTHASSEWLNPYTRTVKRVVDVTIVLVTLPISVPIVLVAALLIRWRMGGNVLFVQERVGLGGRVFKIYKLRTMAASTQAATNVATSKEDKRITPLGHFLRRHRIDELPQFYNVLRGDMSLVGPRPEQLQLTRRYLETIPAFRFRNMLPPGITGWSQVQAGYAADEAETLEKLMYDLYYIKHANFLLDVWIMLKTVRAVLGGHGAR